MYKSLLNASRLLSNNASYFIIGIAIITYFIPDLFVWVKGNTQTCILGFIMLTMGLTLTVNDMKLLVARPFDLLIGTCAQFSLMPLIAYTLTAGLSYILPIDKAIIVGIILVGCCPGGVSSNIMSFLCKGDVAYSVGMTTISTLLAPVVTPLLVLWLAGQQVDVDAWGMFQNILIVTLIPVAIGFFCNYFYGKNDNFKKIQAIMPTFSVLGLACIVGGVIAAVHDQLLQEGVMFFIYVFIIVFCHNSLGYLLGYTVGRLIHFNTAKNRTISIEVGMQNAGLATVLAGKFFIATCPLAVIPCAVSCAWHSISGTILAQYFAWRSRKAEI